MSLDDATKQTIEQQITENKIFLYMKGTPIMPMCGFSAQVIEVLKLHEVTPAYCNILENPEIREGIKVFSDWPTLPQLYVNGEFVGGCDVITELHQNGELEAILAGAK